MAYIDLSDIENFAITDESLTKVLLHRCPQYVVCLFVIVMDQQPMRSKHPNVLTASEHHLVNDSRSADKYASTTSGTMYSLSSLSNSSREKPGSRLLIMRVTCATSFSSNQEPIVDVTARIGVTRGDSDSRYAECRADIRCMTGLVALKFSQASCLAVGFTKTSA